MNITKIKNKIGYFISPPIIQFSPPRTGSTLLWNTLKHCFPDREVVKCHELSSFYKKHRQAPIVASIRNPLDSISSAMLRYKQDATDEVVRDYIRKYQNKRMDDILSVNDLKNAKVIKYEDFAFDFSVMFKAIEELFAVEVGDDVKSEVIEKFDIQRVKQKSDKLGEFSNMDSSDQIHGRHVSEYSGASGYHSEVLSKKQIEMIKHDLRAIFLAFDYDS